MIKVPMTIIVQCDGCKKEERRFVGEYPYNISEFDLLKYYLFSDWRDSGSWIVESDGSVFCCESCKENNNV